MALPDIPLRPRMPDIPDGITEEEHRKMWGNGKRYVLEYESEKKEIKGLKIGPTGTIIDDWI